MTRPAGATLMLAGLRSRCDHALLVGVLQAGGQLGGDLHHFVRGQGTAAEAHRQVLAVGQLWDAQLVVHDLEEIARRDAAVDVRAEDVEVLALLGDEVDVLHVAVGDGHRAARVARLDLVDDLAEQRVEMPGAGGVALALGERLDLEGGPREPVVVLVARAAT